MVAVMAPPATKTQMPPIAVSADKLARDVRLVTNVFVEAARPPLSRRTVKTIVMVAVTAISAWKAIPPRLVVSWERHARNVLPTRLATVPVPAKRPRSAIARRARTDVAVRMALANLTRFRLRLFRLLHFPAVAPMAKPAVLVVTMPRLVSQGCVLKISPV